MRTVGVALLALLATVLSSPSSARAQHVSRAGAARARIATTSHRAGIALPPADDGIRGRALLGALAGGAIGLAVGASAPCSLDAEGPPCNLEGAAVGLAAGFFLGSTLGAWTGGGAARCGAARGLARASSGALLGTMPWATHMLVSRGGGHEPRLGFVLFVTMPLLQAEGATRAVSGC